MGSTESLTDVLKNIAVTLKIERPLAVVDVETTGTWINYDRIVQVALVSITPDLDVTNLDQLINPEMLIPDEVIEIHRITNETVAQAPTFGEIAPSLREALTGHDFVGYNFRFDRDMLEAEFTRVQVPFSFSGSALIDPLHLWQRIEPRTLQDAAERFVGHRPDEAHRADADIETTARVLLGQLRTHGGTEQLPTSVPALSALRSDRGATSLDAGGRIKWRDGAARLNFGKHRGATLEEIRGKHLGYLEWVLTKDFPDDLKTIVREAIDGNYPAEPRAVHDDSA